MPDFGSIIPDERVRRHLGRWVMAVLMFAVVVAALMALRHILNDTSPDQIRAAVKRIGPGRLLLSLGITALSYVVLTGYDMIAQRIIGRRVRYPTTALASFTSYIFSHNFGFAVLTGGTARWRVYRHAGLSLGEVAQIMVLAGVTFWCGVFLLLGIGLILQPGALTIGALEISPAIRVSSGMLLLGSMAVMVFLLHRAAGRSLNLFGWTLVLPTAPLALAQFALAAIDIVLATAALFVLVPGLSLATFPELLLGYVVAFVSGLLSHAPGGVGVFESVMLVALPSIDRATLFAALLIYRCVYYLVPLAVGIALFLFHEAGWGRFKPDTEQAEATQR
jgi:phosphatidylglycerol lysyltransferase